MEAGSLSKVLAVQKYMVVKRELDFMNFKQKIIKEERNMYLYHDKITTKYHEFPLKAVFDISYKPLGKDGGILYLHTNKGVFSYHVDSDALTFIKIFKQYQIK